MKPTISRGIRNNNPLNIRIGNTWLGEVPNPTDSDFEQFVSLRYGLRAAFCILRRYIRRYHRDTVRSIVSAWAPASENNTAMYIGYVSKRMNIDPDASINYENRDMMLSLVKAMAKYECGHELSDKDILDAYSIA